MDRSVAIAVAVVVLAVMALAIWWVRRSRSEHLKQRFGPEYERSLMAHGSAPAAERELADRERRVAKLEIKPLSPEETARFSNAWLDTQKRFVDAPGEAAIAADRLVVDVMQARGYPMGAFDQRAADISVDHPRVVSSYRAARAMVERHRRGESTTEDLRQALVHYRELFADLLDLRTEPLHRAAGGRR